MSNISKQENLLDFQESLNKHFMNLLNKEDNKNTNLYKHDLGLEVKNGYNFFIPLKLIKNVSAELNFEKIFLAKNWLVGFNQIRGEVFTIIDWNLLLNEIFNFNFEKNQYNDDSKIIYLKEHKDLKLGLLVESFNLDYNLDIIDLIIKEDNEITVNDEINKIDLSKISLKDQELIKDLKEIKNGKAVEETNEIKKFWNFFNKIALNKNNLIIYLDVEYLTFYLNDVSPY